MKELGIEVKRGSRISKYRAGILLILLINKGLGIRQQRIINILNFIFHDGATKVSVIAHINNLEELNLVRISRINEEKYAYIDNRHSPKFWSLRKNEIANFFGFRNWYGGIVKTDGTKSTYQRIRKSYPQLVRSRIKHHAFRREMSERSIRHRSGFQTGILRYQNPGEGPGRGSDTSSTTRPDAPLLSNKKPLTNTNCLNR